MESVTFELLGLALCLMATSGATGWQIFRSQRRAAGLRHARATIEAAGFTWRHAERIAALGHRDLTVEARVEVDGEGGLESLTLVVDEPPLPVDVAFEREGIAGLVASDLEVGESRFDDHVRITGGDPLRLQSLLTPAARDAIAAAVQRGAAFHEGRWRARFPPGHVPDAQALGRVAKALAVAYAELATAIRDDPTEALLRQARSDRTASVRLAALALLLERQLATHDLLVEATRDLDPGVRLAAAEALGFDGRPALLEMARTASRTWRVRAAIALAHPPLSAEELAAIHDTLTAALDDSELAKQAAATLGRVGEARAIPPLQRAADSGPARIEASRALAAVRARLVPGTAGQLSLVEAAGGELSEARDGAGGLTEM